MRFSLRASDIQNRDGGQVITDFDSFSELSNVLEYSLDVELDFATITTLISGGIVMVGGLALEIMEF